MSSSGTPHVHAPHGGVNSWRDFFVHIAIITIGLLLALGLEQVVQNLHHKNQSAELEAQMRETFEANTVIDQRTIKVLQNLRIYFVELQSAVISRRHHQSADIPKPLEYTYIAAPSLGPFEAARANGTIAVLSLDRIELYNRIAQQHAILEGAVAKYRDVMWSLRSFRKRYDTQPDQGLMFSYLPPNLTTLTDSELAEYQAIIGDALEAVDQVNIRTRRLDSQVAAMLNGAQTEIDLINATVGERASDKGVARRESGR